MFTCTWKVSVKVSHIIVTFVWTGHGKAVIVCSAIYKLDKMARGNNKLTTLTKIGFTGSNEKYICIN